METIPLLSTAIGLLVTSSATILGGTKWMLGRVEHRTDVRFAEVSARFDRMDTRFVRMDTRFDRMDERLDRMDARMDRTDARSSTLEESLVDLKLDLARFEARTDERFTAIGETLAELKASVARLEGPHPPFLIARG
ncbi:response regulator [Microbacterium testaceum]|uniref:response regulator n=1 Tax=Microbacterium testaceum TaxID=2033 RepID=UPI00380CF650